MIAFFICISTQLSMGVSKSQGTNGKSTCKFKSMKEWKTFRFQILNHADRLALRKSAKVIELTKNGETEFLCYNISMTLNGIEMKKVA